MKNNKATRLLAIFEEDNAADGIRSSNKLFGTMTSKEKADEFQAFPDPYAKKEPVTTSTITGPVTPKQLDYRDTTPAPQMVQTTGATADTAYKSAQPSVDADTHKKFLDIASRSKAAPLI